MIPNLCKGYPKKGLSAQCLFFWAWKRKWAWKPILDLFLHFFTCKVSVSRPLFLTFFTSFTPNLSFFTALTGFFDIFSRVQKKNSRAYFSEFSRVGIIFSRALFEPGNLKSIFFTRENGKCPTKRFLILFLVFFSPTFFYFSRAVWSFLGHIFKFFLGMIFFLSRAEIHEFQGIFSIWTGKLKIFFSGKEFFFRVEFCCFFLGTNFFLRLFSRFFSRPVCELLGQNIENVLGFNFFSRVKKKHC